MQEKRCKICSVVRWFYNKVTGRLVVRATYQENQRLFGEFRCPQCNRRWMSANTWANMGQECRSCRINVLPYKQHPLSRSNESVVPDNRKHHEEKLCEMCKKLGHSCVGE